MEEIEKPAEEKKKRLGHPVEQKCRAVLAVWTERRNPGEVCRELGISWSMLNQWQERAMEGMIQGLRPRVPAEKGVALNPRLALLLDQKVRRGTLKGLERRLAKLQVTKPGEAVEKKV
jgi:transposase-like protein